jgi:hypothetical protein
VWQRVRAAVLAVRAGVAFACVAGALRASPPSDPGAEDPTLLEHLTAGRDLLRGVPAIATFDGGWSIMLQVGTLLASRRFDLPQPEGMLAQQATRVLYGTSWTAMLALEGLAASLGSGGRFDWLAEARYRTDWMFGMSAPACAAGPGAGCGVGIGGYGGIEVRPVGQNLWYEVSGGWLEQRVASDQRRTLSESSWVLSPLAVTHALRAVAGPIGLEARVGPGLYFGMHAAHLHPTPLAAAALGVPWHELYPIDIGVGPGGRAELALTFARALRLESSLVVAPLLLGSRRPTVAAELEPLVAAKRGVPTWRAFSAGIGVVPPVLPMRLGVSWFAGEVSTRPVAKLGYGGLMLRFAFPLRSEHSQRE